jgi:hypothetical protein
MRLVSCSPDSSCQVEGEDTCVGAAFVGFALRASSEETMTTQNNQTSVDENTRKIALDQQLEDFGWEYF